MLAGDEQSAPVAHAVTTAPSVMVTSNSQAMAGATVTFAVASGGGSVTGATATTDATGMAHCGSWTLGNTAGANTLTASMTGATPVTFTATGLAGPVAALTKVSGDNLSAAAGTAIGTAPAVSLADQFGNLVSGQTVTFAVASGGGSVTGATPASGANGIATVGGWTLGAAAGTNTLTAASGSAPTATFTATGTTPITLPSVAGTWHGTWVDTRYNVSGAITSVVLTQTATTVAGTGTIDLNSLGLGVQNGTAAGTISGNVITFTFTAAGIGNGSGTLNGTTGSGTGGVTALNFGNFTFTGTASASLITGTFQFTSPTGGNGTITVTKP
jgi:adhesin/invasin